MISITRCDAATPNSDSASRTPSTKPASWTSRAETLTPTNMSTGVASAACQAAVWRQASRSTQRPIGRIEPCSSAISMNWPGAIRPFSGWRHRTSASTPARRPLWSSMIGW